MRRCGSQSIAGLSGFKEIGMDQFDMLAKSVGDWVRGLWGCSHRKTSFPITMDGASGSETYVVCMLCGQRFAYDWTTMSKTGKRP